MKSLLLFFMMVLCPLAFYAQDDDAPDVMYESILITPENDNIPALNEALTNHNRTFHNEGAHAAHVYAINTGPNTGKLVWMMGPCTFADLDTRPDCGHDWEANVAPHIQKIEQGEYWQMDTELSKLPAYDPNVSPMPILVVRYHEFHRGISGVRINHWQKQVSETIKSMEGENIWWGLFDNLFQQGYAAGHRPHAATISLHSKYADLENGWPFRRHFIDKFGQSAWQAFLDEGRQVQANSWEELWELMPELSGPEYTAGN